jgi:hypothetical protein
MDCIAVSEREEKITMKSVKEESDKEKQVVDEGIVESFSFSFPLLLLFSFLHLLFLLLLHFSSISLLFYLPQFVLHLSLKLTLYNDPRLLLLFLIHLVHRLLLLALLVLLVLLVFLVICFSMLEERTEGDYLKIQERTHNFEFDFTTDIISPN